MDDFCKTSFWYTFLCCNFGIFAVAWMFMFEQETWHLGRSSMAAWIWLTWQEAKELTKLMLWEIGWRRRNTSINPFLLLVMCYLLLPIKLLIYPTGIVNSHCYFKILLVSPLISWLKKKPFFMCAVVKGCIIFRGTSQDTNVCSH